MPATSMLSENAMLSEKETRHAQRYDCLEGCRWPPDGSIPSTRCKECRPTWPGCSEACPSIRLSEFPPVNLWTSPDGAIVALEVPGVASEDLDITIQRDTVTVRGNRPPEPADDRTVVQRQERAHGPFARPIVLPFRVDADKASAKFERGNVTLTLPRPEDDKPHQIKVARS